MNMRKVLLQMVPHYQRDHLMAYLYYGLKLSRPYIVDETPNIYALRNER